MEHLNPIIIVALIIQGLISRVSHLAGSIAGYLITTGILLWGLSVYQDGDAIAIFGAVLSKQVFIFSCIFWYAYDTYYAFSYTKVDPNENIHAENLTNIK